MKVRDLRSMRPNLTLCDSSMPSTSVITTSPTSFFEIITAFSASLSSNWSPSSLSCVLAEAQLNVLFHGIDSAREEHLGKLNAL
jgi:hypothetical protein